MSDFLSENDVAAALAAAGNGGAGCRQDVYRTSMASAAGYEYSGWLQAGPGGPGIAPGAGPWATPYHSTPGSYVPLLVNAGTKTNRILLTDFTMSIAGQKLSLVDRLGQRGGLSGTSVAAQTVDSDISSPVSQGRCSADGSDIMWFLEWYVATGSSAVTATINVTFNDDTTGNTSITIAASTPAGRLLRIPVPSASAGKTIKKVNTVTLSGTTGAVGNFGVTAMKFLCSSSVLVDNFSDKQDYAYLGMPKIGDFACVTGIYYAVGTSVGVLSGHIVIGAA